jgi:hypothetical protein
MNAESGTVVRTLQHKHAAVRDFALRDLTLVSAQDETIAVWNADTGELLRQIERWKQGADPNRIVTVVDRTLLAVNWAQRQIVSATNSGALAIEVHDLLTGAQIAVIACEKDKCALVALCVDNYSGRVYCSNNNELMELIDRDGVHELKHVVQDSSRKLLTRRDLLIAARSNVFHFINTNNCSYTALSIDACKLIFRPALNWSRLAFPGVDGRTIIIVGFAGNALL